MKKLDFSNVESFDLSNSDSVRSLRIHATLSSLRRAQAVKPSILIKVDELPITVIAEVIEKVDEVDTVMEASYHALSTEVNKYLLLQGTASEVEGEGNTEEQPKDEETPVEDPTQDPEETEDGE